MAVRFSGGGLQSYDPIKSLFPASKAPKKKKLDPDTVVKVEPSKPTAKPPMNQGTAAPGAKPNIRTTSAGDVFDVNKPVSLSMFRSLASYKEAAMVKKGEGWLPEGAGGIAAREQQQAETLTALGEPPEAAAELEAKRQTMPGLEPEGVPLVTPIAEIGLKTSVKIGNAIGNGLVKSGIIDSFTPQTEEELAQTGFGKGLGLATSGVAAVTAAIAAAPYIATAGAAVASKSLFVAGALSTAVAGVASYFGYRQVLDYKGGELDTMRSTLAKYTEDGEKMQALVSLGADPEGELNILYQYAEEINYAEATIKNIGKDNILFGYEKEWIEDMMAIRTARTAVQRRIEAVTNIALTGGAEVDPVGLMYTIGEM